MAFGKVGFLDMYYCNWLNSGFCFSFLFEFLKSLFLFCYSIVKPKELL